MVTGFLTTVSSHPSVRLTRRIPTDPVSAFSLAAGVLQVLDVSFRALSTCYEIHKHGSLAQHDDTREITQYILETTRHLENTYTNIPASAVNHNNHVIDLSKRCTETAAEVRFLIIRPSIQRRSPQHSTRIENCSLMVLYRLSETADMIS